MHSSLRATGSGRWAEQSADGVRAFDPTDQEVLETQGHCHARAERHSQSATARKKRVPSIPNCSAEAKAAGTTEHPRCVSDGAFEIVGFVGMSQHAVRERRFHRAARNIRSGDGSDFLAAIRSDETNRRAASGGKAEPETMAAKVSRMCCFNFSSTSSGSARPPALLM